MVQAAFPKRVTKTWLKNENICPWFNAQWYWEFKGTLHCYVLLVYKFCLFARVVCLHVLFVYMFCLLICFVCLHVLLCLHLLLVFKCCLFVSVVCWHVLFDWLFVLYFRHGRLCVQDWQTIMLCVDLTVLYHKGVS